MIGWWPSFRVGVAVRPTTYLAFTCFITRSKVNAETWWHSSMITWPYSATRSFTSSFHSRRSETNNVLSLHLLHNSFESERRDVVALVDDHLAILGDKVLHFLF